MVSLIISLVPFILIIYYFSILKKRELVTWELKSGLRCYSCKDGFPDEFKFGNVRRICKKCERDNSLNLLLGRKKEALILRIKDLLLDDRWHKWQRIAILLALVLSLLGFIIRFVVKVETHLGDVTNIINTLVWVVMIAQLKISSIKKTKL